MKPFILLTAVTLFATTAHAGCLPSEPQTATTTPSKIITGLYNNQKPIPGCLVYQKDEIIGYAEDQAICTLPLQQPTALTLKQGCCDTIPYGDAECSSEASPSAPAEKANGIKLLLTPQQIVANFYKPYFADTQNTPDALATISTYATYALKQAIARNEECEIREKGICNIDADIIINGQDYDLSPNLRLEEVTEGSNKIIRAHFTSLGQPNTVSYVFTKEGAEWKIDDVEAVSYKENGSTDNRWSLKETLAQ